MADGRITVLVENTAGGRGLLGEHGLAFWIEWNGKHILFDTGQGHVLLSNTKRLGIRFDHLDAVALSHSHYDHTGGLGDVLRNSRGTTVYAHPAAFEAKYARNPDGSAREVGMSGLDEQMALYSGPSQRFQYPNGDEIQCFSVAFIVRDWTGEPRGGRRRGLRSPVLAIGRVAARPGPHPRQDAG